MGELEELCFICECHTDSSRFEHTIRDGRPLCSDKCLEEYLNMPQMEFNRLVAEYNKRVSRGVEVTDKR